MSGDRALSVILFATSLILAVIYTPVREELRVFVAYVTAGRSGSPPAQADRAKPATEASAGMVKFPSRVE